MKKRVILALSLFLIGGCQSVNKKMPWYDDEPKPKALAEIKNQVKFAEERTLTGISRSDKHAAVKMSPVISDRIALLSGPKGEVKLFDTDASRIVWQTKIEQGLEATPALSADKKTVALIDKRDRLRVYDTASHRLVMNEQLAEESYASPVIHGQDVIVKTLSGNLSVYSLNDGKQRWHYEPELDDVMVRASSKVFVKGDRLFAGFSDGRVIAFNLQHGNVVWEQFLTDVVSTQDVEDRYDIVADPIGDENLLYVVSFDGQVAALDYTTGKKVWYQSLSTYKNLAQNEDYLFMVTKQDAIYAMHKRSGRIAWKLEDYKYRKLSAPAVVADNVVVYDKFGYVHYLEADTGQTLARTKLSTPLLGGNIAASHKHVIVPLANGKLTELRVG